MTDDEVRALVRAAIARHLGTPATTSPSPSPGQPGAQPAWRAHPSFGRFLLANDQEGACLIEPNVRCNHCGFCQTYGH